MYQGSEVPECGSKCISAEECLHEGCVLDGKEGAEAEDEVRPEVD
jgi:hypothetical protein